MSTNDLCSVTFLRESPVLKIYLQAPCISTYFQVYNLNFLCFSLLPRKKIVVVTYDSTVVNT